MTAEELKKLDNHELNLTLTRLLGYTYHDVKQHKGEAVYEKFWLRPGVKLEDLTADDIAHGEGISLPQFTTYRSLCADAEKTLNDDERYEYANRYLPFTSGACVNEQGPIDLYKLATADPRARTIALILTKQHFDERKS